ncbi:uncharacterized protein LOC118756166 [Rhagoletis pomonella]|uniref:uncharacterized protein LOC118756166 n=1 Tax=Rhagoletis pomonella TaxID=28610 RepID=UPI00177E2C2C|nr:uncharacterized protein LOC118756166 [Rhagoletis pomonella]
MELNVLEHSSNKQAEVHTPSYSCAFNLVDDQDELGLEFRGQFQASGTATRRSRSLLPTALVQLEINGIEIGPFYALLDSGAQPNLISHNIFKAYQLPAANVCRHMVGIEGQPFVVKKKISARVMPWYESRQYIEAEFWILPGQGGLKLVVPSGQSSLTRLANPGQVPFANPCYWESREVQIVLGVQVFAKCLIGLIARNSDNTTMIETTFGIVVLGPYIEPMNYETGTAFSTIGCISLEELDKKVQRLWEMDHVRDSPIRTKEQEIVEQMFIDTYYRDDFGRFVVTIPIKSASRLGSSRSIALKQFFYLEKRLAREPEIARKYIDFMREYERLGHMKEAQNSPPPSELVYYIPHHCVLKKFRVVFNASCKTDAGVSLNEVQMLGEKLQRDLPDIIMRFRRHKIGISCDVKMMFRQIRIIESQYDLQRIFWRESPREKLREYCLTVVTYGMTASAHLAVRCLIQAARDQLEYFPSAARAIIDDFYMDDGITGASNDDEAIRLAREMRFVLGSAGMELCKWQSNSKVLVNAFQSKEPNTLLLSDNADTSVLGLKWHTDSDEFTFVVKTPEVSVVISKRIVLSCVAQLYDPNGYITPVTFIGKIIVQDLWRLSMGWDEQVPQSIKDRWLEFWKDISELERFKLPRYIRVSNDATIQLHGFADASEKGFGAVIYVRVVSSLGMISSELLISKARVAPLKTITIPKLELAAAELLGRLYLSVVRSMEWQAVDYVMWSDSTIVLHWLRKLPCQMKVYVANRVASIQANTDINKWRHVKTSDNPADLLTRGMSASGIVGHQLWLHGPSWLRQPSKEWPKGGFGYEHIPEGTLPELKVHIAVEATPTWSIKSNGNAESVPLVQCASSLDRLIGIMSQVLRFVRLLRAKGNRQLRKSSRGDFHIPVPTAEERSRALELMIKETQELEYLREIRALSRDTPMPEGSKIESLKPTLDRNGLLRVGGRIGRAECDYEMKHPVIIPSGSSLSQLIISKAHQATKHGGAQVMMQYIRQRFWIPRLRSELRKFTHKCVTCARYAKRLSEQLMADLPADRLQVGKPFLHSGVDYAGPFEIRQLDKNGRCVVKRKSWVAIFVCLKTRAVHIDMITDLSARAFIACYERFIARRGRCERMYSDNGTSFVGASKDIARAYERWRASDMFSELVLKGTEWHFMTPAAPHQGGIYEAAVKSMKHHLTRVIGQKCLEYEQFLTLLAQIEAILNSRPLYPLSDDPLDVQALTPGHFLVGEPLVLPPPFDIAPQPGTKGRKLWQERQTMVTHIWQRWRNEYLTTLLERKKWRKEQESLKIGQLVIIKSENFPPSAWALGRVSELIMSKDGLVRNVVVRTATNELARPVQKICVLPVDTSANTE